MLARSGSRESVDAAALLAWLPLLTGTGRDWLIVVMTVSAGVGALELARRDPRLCAYLGFVAALSLAFVIAVRPAVSNVPIVLARYALIVSPLFLLMSAVAFASAASRWRHTLPAPLAVLLPPAAGVALLWLGPIPELYRHPNNWTSHGLFQYQYRPTDRDEYRRWCFGPVRVPTFYEQLGRERPGSVRILEVPWYSEWNRNHYAVLQSVHHQWMAIGFVGRALARRPTTELPTDDPAFRFERFAYVGARDQLAARRIRYVIFHTELRHEIVSARERPPVPVAEWIERYRATYGAPIFRDEQIVVFDVARG